MKHYHKNPRQITKKQKDDLFKWMDEFGDLGCIVINVRTDEELIGGNQRSDYPGIMSGLIQPVITQRFEQPTPQGTVMEGYYEIKGERFKVRWVDWDDKKAERANLIANKAGGTFDMDILANQFDLPVLLDSGFEERELIGFDFGEPKDAEPQTDRAAELLEKWQVKTGDLWQIGEHRLICGDCTDAAVVARVMGGEKAQGCFTSPPYNGNTHIDYGKGNNKKLYENDADNLSEVEWLSLTGNALSNAISTIDNGFVFWNINYNANNRSGYIKTVLPFIDNLWETVIWKKTGVPVSNGFTRNYEFIFVFGIGNHGHINTPFDNKSNLWEVSNLGANDKETHRAAFPVELAKKAIEFMGVVIYEPFNGTGTTLVACQNLSRRGRAVEISPAYCAVTLERMSTAFPELEIVRIENDPQD